MVNHNQKGIKTIRKWEVHDQVTRDLLEQMGTGGQNGEGQGLGWMHVDLVLLASSTSMDITANIGCEAWPPEF